MKTPTYNNILLTLIALLLVWLIYEYRNHNRYVFNKDGFKTLDTKTNKLYWRGDDHAYELDLTTGEKTKNKISE